MSQADERLISPKAGGNVVDDAPLGGGKRWVVVRPGGAGSADLLLARAASKEQLARVAGNR
jgi:putative peptidoglycan lipid II flippase